MQRREADGSGAVVKDHGLKATRAALGAGERRYAGTAPGSVPIRFALGSEVTELAAWNARESAAL